MPARRCLACGVFSLALAIAWDVPPLGAQERDDKDKDWKPPEGWKQVAAAQFAEIGPLMAQGGYLCWVESRLVPETARNRAQSFDRRLYRLKLGAKPEQIYQKVTTGIIEPLLGPGGAVATRFDYPEQRLFLPGHPPGKLPQVEGYHPKAFTAGGLLCHAQRYHGSGGYYDSSLALIPIIEGKARPDTAELLLPWTVGEFTPDGFRRWGTFRRGDYLIYALPGPETVAKSGKRRPGKLMLTVWDLKKKAKAWDVEGIPLAADDRYVYAYSQADGALVRRPLAGRGAGTRLSVPGLENILEVRPPKLLGLFGNDRVLSAFDLETGDRSDFDIRVSRASTYPVGGADAQDRPLYLRKDGPHAPFLSVARDDDTGVLYASRGTAIYEVPVVARHPATEKPKWEPLP